MFYCTASYCWDPFVLAFHQNSFPGFSWHTNSHILAPQTGGTVAYFNHWPLFLPCHCRWLQSVSGLQILLCGKQALESIFLNVPVWPLWSSRMGSHPKSGWMSRLMWHLHTPPPTSIHIPSEYEKVYYLPNKAYGGSKTDFTSWFENGLRKPGKETGLECLLWLWGGAGVSVPMCGWAEVCVLWISHCCQRREHLSFLNSVPDVRHKEKRDNEGYKSSANIQKMHSNSLFQSSSSRWHMSSLPENSLTVFAPISWHHRAIFFFL